MARKHVQTQGIRQIEGVETDLLRAVRLPSGGGATRGQIHHRRGIRQERIRILHPD